MSGALLSDPSSSRTIVIVMGASVLLVERCRNAVADAAFVVGSDVDRAHTCRSLGRVRVLVVTADVFGREAHAITDVARRLQARVVKLPSENMPDRYLGEAILDAMGSSGVRRMF